MQFPFDASADGKWTAYSQRAGRGTADVFVAPIAGGDPVPIATTPFDESDPAFSPDGRLVAFSSNETGRREVYLTAVASPGVKRRLSSDGGGQPRWSRDGAELFYLSRAAGIMSVRMRRPPSLETESPSVLFTHPQGIPWSGYDVAPNGRFLAVIPVESAATKPLTVIVNWSPR
jgi:Tol biopolymer transport system component